MARSATVVFLTSISLLGLELIWTRLFSAEFFYTFAFLILSLAVMGIGVGGLAVRILAGNRDRRGLGWVLLCAALCALAGPPFLFAIGIDFTQLFTRPITILQFVATLCVLGASFFFAGMALAMVFRAHHGRIAALYTADLLGAGTGVFGAIVVMNRLGTPAAAFWITAPLVAAALIAAPGWRRLPVLGAAVLMVSLVGFSDTLLESKREERAPVIYKHWDAMAKIKIYDFGGRYRGINIDNVANTPVIPFDGVWEDDATAEATNGSAGGSSSEDSSDNASGEGSDNDESNWDIDVRYLIAQFDSCRFLSLGSGGGMDVLQALDHGAAEIHAVEVNGHINRMMREGDPAGYVTRDSSVVDSTGRIITCAEYSGHIYQDPRVRVVTEDARTYVQRHRNSFDVIYSLSSNTWAALGSGSFALAENYLFTTEAFEDYWHALSDSGFLSMEHQVYMPRLASEVIDALEHIGIAEPRAHFAIYNLPKLRRNVLLLSRRPLTDEVRRLAYRELTPERHGDIHLLYPAADSLTGNLVNQVVTAGWVAAQDSAKVNLSPCTDDRPFIAQMGRWQNLEWSALEGLNKYAEFRGFPMSKLIIAIVLVIVCGFVLPLTFLPYFRRGDRLGAAAWLYFFLIGVAFMSVEIILIQKYTLFIGASVYSIATVLLTLLAASGFGSLVSPRVRPVVVFAAIAVWLVLDVFVWTHLTGALIGLPMAVRVAVTAALIAPLGFFMGMPFPKGALRVRELVDWGFAVNGVASVLGATLIVLVAFACGYRIALMGAAAVYIAAGVLLHLRRAW